MIQAECVTTDSFELLGIFGKNKGFIDCGGVKFFLQCKALSKWRQQLWYGILLILLKQVSPTNKY